MATARQIESYSLPTAYDFIPLPDPLINQSTPPMSSSTSPLSLELSAALQSAHGLALDLIHGPRVTGLALSVVMSIHSRIPHVQRAEVEQVSSKERHEVLGRFRPGPIIVSDQNISEHEAHMRAENSHYIRVKHQHIEALSNAIMIYGSNSIEAYRHRFFTAIVIVHECAHWLRTFVAHQHSTPPGLGPMACGFQSGEGWDENEEYIEGEAGFWLEEVAINGIIGYIENKPTSDNNIYVIKDLVLKSVIDSSPKDQFQAVKHGLNFYVPDEVLYQLHSDDPEIFSRVLPIQPSSRVPKAEGKTCKYRQQGLRKKDVERVDNSQ